MGGRPEEVGFRTHIVPYRKMVPKRSKFICQNIILACSTVTCQRCTIDKRTTHASGTPLALHIMYYTYISVYCIFSVYIFTCIYIHI